MHVISESIILLFSGVILLRFAGRKSISQLTIAQTVIMISIGSLIIQPIVEKTLWQTIVAAATFIGFLWVMEYLQLRYNFIEKILKGHAVPVIEDGRINEKNLRKLRMTVDQLEIRLRQQGVTSIRDAKMVTVEANGQLGIELKRKARPLTIGEFEKLMAQYLPPQKEEDKNGELFEEIVHHKKHYPERLE